MTDDGDAATESSEAGSGEPRRDGANIGTFIREQRMLAEMSLRKLADTAGVSNPYLSQIERGLRKPSADILQQVAKALQMSAETMYVQAGILDSDRAPEPTNLEAAIKRAVELSDEQRKALLGVYRSFVMANDAAAAAAGSSSTGADPAD